MARVLRHSDPSSVPRQATERPTGVQVILCEAKPTKAYIQERLMLAWAYIDDSHINNGY
jgi:hypothetical protein